MSDSIRQPDLEVTSEPHTSILAPREIAAEAGRAHSVYASALLREIVNNGTWVLVRCTASGCGELDVDLAAPALYRTVIEMADGIDVSVRGSAVTPAVPQLRTLFEASLQLEYILQDPQQYRDRALAWCTWFAIARMRSYERFDKTTPSGKAYLADKAADVTGASVADPDPVQVTAAIARMQSLLAKPHLVPFKQRYDSMVAARRRPTLWCQLCNGPSNRRELARLLRHPLAYATLYSHWSATSHAEDLYQYFLHVPGKGSGIRPLRDASDLLRVAGMAATFTLGSTKQMLDHFRAGEDGYSRWYKEKVQSLFRAVMGFNRSKQS